MTSKTKNALAVEEFDFEGWTDEAENAALAVLAGENSIQYVISENRFFVGRFKDGRIIKTPLVLSVNLLEAVTGFEDQSDVEQIKHLMELLGKDEDLEYLNQADIFSAIDYAQKYFSMFEKITRLTMGESLS
ncbi:Uncharacterised protein [Chlamydia trachomatis]|uniref:hypothetical protein n=1 Tax=Actinomycetaceae TaxID=2049 RepID=UPI00061D50D8|nr:MULTISPECIES: hypothetical protein [Actinomycetaceae]MDK7781347.1 hypothetical protein [Actinomycetaceae bacterium UMB8041B]MDK8609087.1 hypothetical protein [Actinomycetaceae bacterium UMB8041A]MDK8753982.1 hypothetical protein [Actinomycetaceae bacterium UMB8039A]CRH91293.1 Uncharacterised protein [Chlamydia trachomatis]MDK6829854.1 hypothetical protein [Pauljensenia sp. UMB8040A]